MKSFLKNTKIFLAVTILVISYFGIFSNPQKVSADVCNVTSANFRTSPGAQYPTNNFTAPGNYPYVYVDVQTTGCVGSTIYVSLNYFSPSIFGAGSWYSVDNANHIPVSITAGLESFTLEFVAGQQGCISDVNDWDCRYRIATWTMLGLDNTDTSVAGGHSWNDVYNPGNNMVSNMMLEYDCHESLVVGVACSQSPAWQYIPQIFPFGTVSSLDIYTSTGVNTLSPGAIDDSYLAPLPGITVGSASTLGGYLRALFSVLILIAGILAFIMVVIGAVTYLSSDAFSGKSEGKEMILNAVFGLILALGAWIILNTINPNLASNLEITIPDVVLDGPTTEWQGGNAAAGSNIAPTKTLNGQPILMGQPWPSDATQRQLLSSAGISVVSSQNSSCPTAGSPGCTSVYFEGAAASIIQQIIQFKTTCGGCDIVITGGSEAWLHASHGPNVKRVDMRATSSLNGYLNGLPGGPSPGTGFPTNQTIIVPNVGSFWAEPSGSTSNTTAQHWHVTFY